MTVKVLWSFDICWRRREALMGELFVWEWFRLIDIFSNCFVGWTSLQYFHPSGLLLPKWMFKETSTSWVVLAFPPSPNSKTRHSFVLSTNCGFKQCATDNQAHLDLVFSYSICEIIGFINMISLDGLVQIVEIAHEAMHCPRLNLELQVDLMSTRTAVLGYGPHLRWSS